MKRTALWIILVLVALVGSEAVFAKKYPETSDDGLQKIKHKGLDAVYWREGAELTAYERVMIGDVDVAFRKNWMRDQNRDRRSVSDRVDAEDMERIREAVAEGFTEMFTSQLEEGGYEVVTVAGNDVLKLEPSIVDLDVRAPDLQTPGRVTTYTTSAGEMTLNMAIYDSGSNSLIGRVIDERRAMDTGRLEYTNRITNKRDADIMFRAWARQLVKALDDAHQR